MSVLFVGAKLRRIVDPETRQGAKFREVASWPAIAGDPPVPRVRGEIQSCSALSPITREDRLQGEESSHFTTSKSSDS